MMKLLAWLVVLLVGFALAQPASAQGRGGGGPSGGGPSGSVGAAQGVGSAVSPIVINPYTTGLEKAGEVADENADFGLGTAGGSLLNRPAATPPGLLPAWVRPAAASSSNCFRSRFRAWVRPAVAVRRSSRVPGAAGAAGDRRQNGGRRLPPAGQR